MRSGGDAGTARVADTHPPAGRHAVTRQARVWPAAYATVDDRRRILGWLGVGLVVRLALMPFAVSSDLLAIYWRSHVIAYDGEVYAEYLVNMGAHAVHAASLRLLAPLLPAPDDVWTDPWWWSDSFGLIPQVLREFSARPDVGQTLFALKLPYLAADLGAGVLLLVALGACAPALARRAWAFWMLSPIGLYATYVFARYEAFPVLCVVGALVAVERRRPWLGALLLGVGITMRTYPLLLVPIFALVAVGGLWRRAAWAGLAVAPFAVVMLGNLLVAGNLGELEQIAGNHTGTTYFAFTVPVEGIGQVLLFPLAALLIVGVLAGRQLGWWGAGPVAVTELWVWLFVFHAAMFAVATFSAHYLMWLTPFVALALARRPAWRGALWLHLGQVVCALGIADLLGVSLAGLFTPLSPALARLPSLFEFALGVPGRTAELAALLRTVFLACTALLVWPALTELWRRGRGPAPHPEPGA